MKRAGIKLLALLSLAAVCPAAALAQDGLVRLTVGAAQTDYSIKFDANAPGAGALGTYKNTTAKSEYTAASVSLTLISAKGLYFDVTGTQSGSATHDLWATTTPATKDEFSHDSIVATFGFAQVFQTGGSLSVFMGYRKGETELAAPKPPGVFSRDTFESSGVFFGMGGGFPALGGSINMSGAIAFMSGKWTDDNGFYKEADYTFGYSFGIGYTYRIGKHWAVTLDYRYQLYNYTFDTSTTIATPAYDITEKISAVGLKLSLQF